MRITTGMMAKKYLKNLNKSEERKNYASHQVDSGRKFFKGSEDPVGAIKAYKLRREFRNTEMYETNISDADAMFTVAESNLTQMNTDLQLAWKSTLKGITGTMSPEDREIIAKQVDSIQKSMLTELNAKMEDKYVFGGTSKEEIPFTLDADGNLLYKGFDVTTGHNTKLSAAESALETPEQRAQNLKNLQNETLNVDLGLGIEVTSSGEVKESSVFDISLAGIKFLGCGTDEESGLPNNIYTLLGNIKEQLRSDSFSIESIQPYLTELDEEKNTLLIGVTDIGTKSTYLEFLDTRNTVYKDNLNKRILAVENIETADAATDFAMKQYCYNAALAMGTKILSNSLIDYMS